MCINESNYTIIIFGASIVGQYALEYCKNNNIEVECFCDNNPDKIHSKFNNLEVKSLKEIKETYDNVKFLISVVDMQDIVKQLEENNFYNYISCNEILKDIDHPLVSNMVLSHDNYLNKDKLFIRGVDLVITEKCSLKCKDCSNLMSYYNKPKDIDNDNIFNSIGYLGNLVDKIGEVRIIGGEPFMNKNIYEIISLLNRYDKINQIVIYTNGTILPSNKQIKKFKNSKVSFYISNYGKLSKNFTKLINLLKDNNISYKLADIKWTNCSEIKQNNRSKEDNQKLFNVCCVKNLFTLLNNKLYRCPFFANADNLQAIPNFANEYIDLSNTSKEQIKNYILDKNYLKVCDFCNGRSFDDKEIEANIQIKQSLPYKRYSR